MPFFCCLIYQNFSTPSIMRCYIDCDLSLVWKERRLRGFRLILKILNQFRWMGLLLRFTRSGVLVGSFAISLIRVPTSWPKTKAWYDVWPIKWWYWTVHQLLWWWRGTHHWNFLDRKLYFADSTNWMTANKLKLNTDKTELLIIHSRFRLLPPPPPPTTTNSIH